MTQRNASLSEKIHSASIGKRMLQGAGIAFGLMSMFLLSVGEPNPEWPQFWMLRPLIVVSCAGAMGGVFYYLMDHLRYQGGWKKGVAILLSIVGYIFLLWIGSVLGLDGTMWD